MTQQKKALVEISSLPEGMVYLARYRQEIIGYITFHYPDGYSRWSKHPGILELAKEVDAEPEELAVALEAMRPHLSIYEHVYDDGSEATLLDRMEHTGGVDRGVVDRTLLKELLSKLEARERQLIVLRYFQDKTQSEIAKLLGVSQVQVSRLESRILNKLREAAR